MMVLTRRLGEMLRFGESIQLIALNASPYHVRIGIEAPKNIQINRSSSIKKNAKIRKKKIVF